MGEENQKVSSLGAKLPFDETLNLEGIASGDKMCLKWEIEDLSVHMIHSRKLNIKAIVTFYAVVDEMAGIQLPVEISEEGISVKRKKVRLMSLMVHKKDTMRIKDEVTLVSNKPNIEQLLWYTIDVRGMDLRPEGSCQFLSCIREKMRKIRFSGQSMCFRLIRKWSVLVVWER